MKIYAANGKDPSGPQSCAAIYRAIQCLPKYVTQNPEAAAVIEKLKVIRRLPPWHMRWAANEPPSIAQSQLVGMYTNTYIRIEIGHWLTSGKKYETKRSLSSDEAERTRT